jgi:hypothetical protein
MPSPYNAELLSMLTPKAIAYTMGKEVPAIDPTAVHVYGQLIVKSVVRNNELHKSRGGLYLGTANGSSEEPVTDLTHIRDYYLPQGINDFSSLMGYVPGEAEVEQLDTDMWTGVSKSKLIITRTTLTPILRDVRPIKVTDLSTVDVSYTLDFEEWREAIFERAEQAGIAIARLPIVEIGYVS